MTPGHVHSYRIRGLDCAEEVHLLKQEVGPVVGGADFLSFDLLNATMHVHPAAPAGSPAQILKAIARAGLAGEYVQPLQLNDAEQRLLEAAQDKAHRQARLLLTVACGLLAVLGVVAQGVAQQNWRAALLGETISLPELLRQLARQPWPALSGHPHLLVFAAGIALGLWPFLPKAWRALVRFRPDMNLLMAIAVFGAVLLGDWLEAITVCFLFSLSLVLESWSVARARRAVAALLELTPPTARVRRGGGEELVSPGAVAVGETCIVHAGERLPLDGQIAQGESSINHAAITGESLPVFKRPGDDVYAGTINGDGLLEIVCTKLAKDSTMAKVAKLVGEAQARKAPAEQWVDRFATIYTPAVMAAAVAVFVLPPLFWDGDWARWWYAALVLLVIACPCALVISTPVSVVSALACAARQGVLIKGGKYLEAPAGLAAIAFDKTGTLTLGSLEVVQLEPDGRVTPEQLLGVAASLELRSNHPLAKAIVTKAAQQQIQTEPVENARAWPGRGVSADYRGQTLYAGSWRFITEQTQPAPEWNARVEHWNAQGHTVVAVADTDKVWGLIALAEKIRESAATVIADLKSLGITHLALVTGDHPAAADRVSQQVALHAWYAPLLPEEKTAVIEKLIRQFQNVAMVGDGVNDAPALSRASVGIAMAAIGSDAAVESADVALLSDDLTKLPWLIRHARRSVAVIRQNVTLALAIKALFLLLAVFGMATLWSAIAADMGASLLVIANGLRLLQAKDVRSPQAQ